MIITDEKILVTLDMMKTANMTRGEQLGIPDGKGSLKWRGLLEMTEQDFDAIENYFIKRDEKGKTIN